MKLISINTGKKIPFDNTTGETAIYKAPRKDAVRIGKLGLDGDEIADLEVHGGTEQAVYVYFQEDYAFWKDELGEMPLPGTFGENLTIEGMSCQDVLIGDRFIIGNVVLEITAPRIPCSTFAKRMGDKLWVKRFHAAQRPGPYARVISEGEVSTGDEVNYQRFEGEPIPVIELTADYQSPSRERMEWLLKTPIHEESRKSYEERLGRA